MTRQVLLAAAVAAAFPFRPAFAAAPCKLGPFEVGFDLRLARPGAETRHVKPIDMKTLETSVNDGVTTAVWKGSDLCGSDFTVTATFAEGEGGWMWRFRYEGNAAKGLDVEQIRFPVLDVPRTDRTAVVVPRSIGQLRRPDWKSLKCGQDVAGAVPHSFRFIAALDDEVGSVYLDERGARGFAGKFVAQVGPRPGLARLFAEHWLAVTESSNRAHELPYGGLFKAYRGGWFEAATTYRDWVRGEPWAKAARTRAQPQKLRDIALWMWNRGPADHVLASAERFQDETGLKPALDWYWWHKIPYDTGYPYFWPPREGEATFRAAVARMKKRGIFSQVYTNGMTWDCDDPTFKTEGGLESVIISKRGHDTYERHLFNTYTQHALAYMCGEGTRHHDFFVGLTKQLADCGLDGLYIDQIGCCSLACCWNPAHGHVPGGGTTQTDGYRAFFRRVKATNPDLLLSTEEPSEEYLDCTDEAICLWQTPERFGTPGSPACEAVPVFTALHHGEIALFGTYAVMGGRPPWDPTWPDKDRWKDEAKWQEMYPADQFALEVASGPVWGVQPCVHNLTLEQIGDPRLAADWKFLKDTARFYYENRDLLYDGEMCAPGKLDCARKPLTMAIRGIYTTEKNVKLIPSEPPAVLHCVWKAKDGRVAAVFANWTSEEQSFVLDCPAGKTAGKLPPRTWHRVPLGVE